MIRQNSFSDIRLYFLIRDTEGYGGSYLINNLMLYGTHPFFLIWLSRKRLMWSEPFFIPNFEPFEIYYFQSQFLASRGPDHFFLFPICFDIAFFFLIPMSRILMSRKNCLLGKKIIWTAWCEKLTLKVRGGAYLVGKKFLNFERFGVKD